MIYTRPHLSHEMRCRCANEAEIATDAPSGTIHECSTCTTSYVNDGGKWRNTLTLSKRQLHKLMRIAAVEELLAGRR